MEKITYGAPRFMDWVAQIKAGAATVRVHFAGGALTAYGVTPAEYTTANPFVQKVIEQSQYFKEGRIVKLRSTTVADPVDSVKTKKSPAKSNKPTASPAEPTAPIEITAAEKTDESCKTAEFTAEELTEVEVSCLQDAQDYLQQNYGVSSYKVRSKVSAQKVASEHGIKFTGPGFNSIEEEACDNEE